MRPPAITIAPLHAAALSTALRVGRMGTKGDKEIDQDPSLVTTTGGRGQDAGVKLDFYTS